MQVLKEVHYLTQREENKLGSKFDDFFFTKQQHQTYSITWSSRSSSYFSSKSSFQMEVTFILTLLLIFRGSTTWSSIIPAKKQPRIPSQTEHLLTRYVIIPPNSLCLEFDEKIHKKTFKVGHLYYAKTQNSLFHCFGSCHLNIFPNRSIKFVSIKS